jgi:hypothetical protein
MRSTGTAPARGMAGLDDLAHGDTLSAPKSLAAGGKRKHGPVRSRGTAAMP